MPHDSRMDEPILKFLQRRLNESKGDWPKIAETTGVPYGTVVNIAQGKSTNPTLSSVQPLIDYYRELDAMVERLRHPPAERAAA